MMGEFSHFKGKSLTRSEKIQKKLHELLLKSNIPDSKRDSSLIWELRHSSGVCQIGRILAQRRKLNVEIAELISILHDIYTILTGSYERHAIRGSELARKILLDSKEFSDKEISIITEAIAHHSEKDIHTKDPYIELIKDADVFDCSLYQKSDSGYRLYKSETMYKETVKRAKKVRKELGLPDLPVLRQK